MIKRILGAILIVGVLCSMMTVAMAEQTESTVFYVSATGNDDAVGGIDTPFKTLEKARDTVRNLKTTSGLPNDGVTVFLRKGSYNIKSSFVLDTQDSGEVGKEIVYRAYKDEKVSVVGGGSLSPTAFSPVTDAEILSRLPAEAKDKVVKIDLKSQGITEFGEISKGKWTGLGWTGQVQEPELFVNSKAMTLSRYPNQDYLKISSILIPGSNTRAWQKDRMGYPEYVPIEKRENPPVGVTFTYADNEPAKWTKAEDIWIRGFLSNDWFAENLQVESIDIFAKSVKTVTPGSYPTNAGQRYYYYNLLEELDVPGEWYLDRKTGILYLYPAEDIANADILLSTIATPLFDLNKVSNIQIRGISFESGRKNGINIVEGENNLIYNCTVQLMGGCGINIEGGKNHGVVSCSLHDNGAGGVFVGLVGGPYDKSPARDALIASGNYVENNDIHDVDRIQKTGNDGISLYGIGTEAVFNELYNSSGQGLSFFGNDQLIQYNYLHDLVKSTSDSSAIYSGRSAVHRGNVIKNNFIQNIAKDSTVAVPNMVHAIYFDDCLSGQTVEGNVISDVKDGVFINGGRDHTVKGNIFINVDKNANPVSIKAWGLGNNQAWFGTVGGIFGTCDPEKSNLRLNSVPFDKPPYTKYPHLAEYLTDEPAWPKYNVVKGNAYYKTSTVETFLFNNSDPAVNLSSLSERNTLEGNVSLSGDLGFVDEANNNFALKDTSVIYEKIPGFEKIPFEKIGRYTNKVNKRMSNAIVLGVGEFSALVNNKESYVDESNLNVKPVIVEGRTLLPVRFIAESFGAKVDWDAQTQEITVSTQGSNIKLKLGSNIMNVNGTEKTLDVPAQSINSRTFIPLRALAEALGKNVFWDDRGLIIISNEKQIFDPKEEDYMINEVLRKIKVN